MKNQPFMIARCTFRAYCGPAITPLPHWSRYTMCGVRPALLCYDGDYLCAKHFERYMLCGACGCAESTTLSLLWNADVDAPLCPACLAAHEAQAMGVRP
jgi:hypothetical protein